MQKKIFFKILFNFFSNVSEFLFFSITLIFYFYFVNQVQAQTFTDDIIFQHVTIEDGLSQNTSFCIHQDRKGFMWFATEDGLNRYNGYKFKVYKKDLKDPTSIAANYILSMYEDRKGNLWFGTDGGGLNQYDSNNENFVRYMNIPDDKNSLSHNRVNTICEDTSGNIWVGTNGGGLDKLDPETKKFTHYKYDPETSNSLSSNNVYSVICDKSGFLWIGTDNGLNKFNLTDESFLRYYADPGNPYSLSFNYILYLFKDKADILWIGTSGGGLNKLIPSDNEGSPPVFISYKNDYRNPASISGDVVTSIFEDKSGVLWIGTDGNGLNKLIPGDKKGSLPVFSRYKSNPGDPNSIVNSRILSIYEDRSGVLWIGTKGGGISKYDREKKNFFLIRNKSNDTNSISHNAVRVLSEDRSGNLWIGTDGGGLDRFNRDTGTYTHYRNNPRNPNSLGHNYIRSIHQDRKGYLWVGTDGGGVNKLDIKTGKFTRYKHDAQDPYSLGHNTIRPILEDNQGLLWIGTFGAGLDLFDRQKNRFIHYVNDPNNPKSISHNYIYCLYEDRSGVLWVGTDGGGLNRFDREKEIFDNFKHDPGDPNSLSQDNVYAIYEDDSGILWLGTRGGGLNKFDPEKQSFIHYTEKDGLPNETIYGILGDEDGNIWISTNRGISKFDPNEEKFKNYDINDGLQSNEFNGGAYFKSKDGAMYFGGINGMNKFFPGEIKDNPNIPPVVITDFQIFNKPVPIGEELDERIILKKSIVETEIMELSYKDRVFSFEFAALNYVAPEKNQYAYMMENFESEWNYIGERKFVSYTNLPPGDYIFRVKASNCDGVWNEEGTSLNLTITPPFWETTWFRILVIIILLSSVYLIYRIRVRSIQERSRELEENVKKRTKQATLLYETGQRLSSELELDSLLSEIVNTICESFNYYGVMLLLPNGDKDILTMRSVAGDFTNVFSGEMTVKIGEGMIGKAAATKEIQTSGDVSKDATFVLQAEEKTKSELSVPILSGETVIGVLDIQSDKLNAFEKSDIAALETLSTHIASAIDNARLYTQAQLEISERKKAEKDLRRAKRETDDILENVKEGLFLLDQEYKIGSQYSAALEEILSEQQLAKISFTNYLHEKVDKITVDSVLDYLDILFDNEIDENTLSQLNPLSQIEISLNGDGSKFLTFDFRRIKENEKTVQIISTVNDITEKINLEKDLEETREESKRKMDWLLCIMNVEPVMLQEFVQSAHDEISNAEIVLKGLEQKEPTSEALDDVYRSVHTVKGNASLLELDFFADRAHQVEDKIAELKTKDSITPKDISELQSLIDMIQKVYNEMKGLIEQIKQIHDQFRPKRSHEHNLLIKSLTKLVDNLGKEYKKQIKFISDNFKGENIPYKHRLLIRDILVQLIRNSMFHGIESDAERKEKSKQTKGTIEIENYNRNGDFVIKFKDDGRGLLLDKLREKAKELGKWSPDEIDNWEKKELVEVIFVPGVTTSEHTNMTAGRGMGMDIIKNKIDKIGGKIDIKTEEDKFTEFNVILPIS